MSNEEAANIPPLITIAAIVIAFILLMLYQYRLQVKMVAMSIKGGVIALLVMLGIIDEITKPSHFCKGYESNNLTNIERGKDSILFQSHNKPN